MNDVEIIKQLNSKLRIQLKQRDKLAWFLKGYCINEEGHVTQLNLFNAQVNGQIPDEVFQLKHLQHLDIRDNNLSRIPEDIKHLKQLQFLDARNNDINDLPQSIAQLDNLEKLYLANNKFTTVPTVISELESLWLIDLIDNTICKGCEYLFSAPMLTNIYLKNNKIENFPFDNITAYIDELNISENPITTPSTFKHDMVSKLII